MALVRRLRAGDEAAFDAFFAEYFPRLYRFACVRLGGDEDTAQDVTQAALIQGLRKIDTFRGEAALFTWLCTICRHEVGAARRRAGQTETVSLSDDSPDIRAVLDAIGTLSRDDPDDAYQRREVARRVHAALDHLPGTYGEALTWKYLEGHSVEEVARRLGLGYKAAESVLTRARAAFREAFATITGDWHPPMLTTPRKPHD